MANDLESAVWEALKTVKFPGMSRDIVSFGFVHQVSASAGMVVVDLQMSTHNPAAGEKVRDEVERAVRAVPGVAKAQVNMNVSSPPPARRRPRRRSPRTPTSSPRSGTWWRWPAARAAWASRPWRPTWR